MRPLELRGARVVVTGALGGIAQAAIPALQERGARVVGIDLRDGPDVIAADVRDPGATRTAMDEAARRLGGIDILVNCAGIGRGHDSGDFPDPWVRNIVEVNFFGTWHATAAAMPHLLRGLGHVVNLASGLAAVTMPWTAAYTASKRAVTAYSDVLRLEYRGRITVTTVYPGYIRTGIHLASQEQGTTLEGMVHADTVADAGRAIVVACTKRPRSVTTGRRTGMAVTLARHAPRLVDAAVALGMRRARGRRPQPAFLRVYDDAVAPEVDDAEVALTGGGVAVPPAT